MYFLCIFYVSLMSILCIYVEIFNVYFVENFDVYLLYIVSYMFLVYLLYNVCIFYVYFMYILCSFYVIFYLYFMYIFCICLLCPFSYTSHFHLLLKHKILAKLLPRLLRGLHGFSRLAFKLKIRLLEVARTH